jgi:hypothetical protein
MDQREGRAPRSGCAESGSNQCPIDTPTPHRRYHGCTPQSRDRLHEGETARPSGNAGAMRKE